MTSRIIPYQTHRYHQQQKLGGCGMYTLKNVIESFQDEIDLTIKNYAPTFWNKISGFMLPSTITKVLIKFGLHVTRGRYKIKGVNNKINFLKELLHKGPVILVIGHAYKGKKDFNLLKAVSVQHYMSVRGYNDQKGIFYVYDSGAPKRLIRKDLPVGNIALKYKDLIKYRKFGGFMIKKYSYISIDYQL